MHAMVGDVPQWSAHESIDGCCSAEFRQLHLLVHRDGGRFAWEVSNGAMGTIGCNYADDLETAKDRATHFAYGYTGRR